MSRKPSVTRSAVFGPVRSMTALVTTVVAWTITSVTAPGATLAFLSTESIARKKPISRLSGVVRVLSTTVWPDALRRTTSVKVPPISTARA